MPLLHKDIVVGPPVRIAAGAAVQRLPSLRIGLMSKRRDRRRARPSSATLYELDGAVRYRVLAYREAATAIRESPVSVAELAARRPGHRAARRRQDARARRSSRWSTTGEIPSAAKLKAKFPPTLIEVTRVPGRGREDRAAPLRRARRRSTWRTCGPRPRQERIRELKGLGAEGRGERPRRARASSASRGPRRAAAALGGAAGRRAAGGGAARRTRRATQVEVAGSARRWAETCKDIDLIATAERAGGARASASLDHPLVAAAGIAGPNGAADQTHNGISVDLRIVAPEAFGNLLQHFTGSAGAQRASCASAPSAMGLSVSEHGITETETGEVTLYATEAEVYERLGYAYIEPELREGSGELAGGARRARCRTWSRSSDIRGDLHCHTTLSDGRNTLEEMAEAARERGYAYLAITDHSASHGFGDHVTAERLWERIEEVRGLERGQARLPRCSPARRSTSASTARSTTPTTCSAALDWVVASVHTSFAISEKEMTERVLAAIENPHVDCIGHLTGRLIGRREPYGIDVEAVAEAAARTGTMLEINGNPNRRDLSEHHARLAAEAGATIVLNTDAHGVDTLDNMAYAVATARRAWLTKADRSRHTRTWKAAPRSCAGGTRFGQLLVC